MKSFIIFLLLIPIFVTVKVYILTDNNGKVHASDSSPPDQQAEIIDEEPRKKRIRSASFVSEELAPIEFSVNRQSNMPVMYATQWRKHCERAKN